MDNQVAKVAETAEALTAVGTLLATFHVMVPKEEALHVQSGLVKTGQL